MTDYTASQVESAIESSPGFESWGEADNWTLAGPRTNWSGKVYEATDDRLFIAIDDELIPVEFVDGKMPAEEGGSSVWVVVRAGTQLFRKNGYYASHYGTDWDGSFDEVIPSEKVITVYEEK